MHIVLGSSSPRRIQLLEQIGLEFTCLPPDDSAETPLDPQKKTDPFSFVRENARSKALWTANHSDREALVIGADTIVVVEDDILGKPHSGDDARRMLRRLSGKVHQVVTAVALIHNGSGREAAAEESTDVIFKEMSEREILDYIASGEPADKAGAYGIQGRGAQYIKGIRGCYFNVMGLPLYRTVTLLRQFCGDEKKFFKPACNG